MTEFPPNRDAVFQWQVAGVCVPSLASQQVRRRRHPPGAISPWKCHTPQDDDVKRQESVAGRLVSHSRMCLVMNDITPSSL